MNDSDSNYFTGFHLPGELHSALQLAQQHLPKDGVRYTLTEDFHVTFNFLGPLTMVKALEVQLLIDQLLKSRGFSNEIFQLSITGIDYFYNKGLPSVVFASVKLSQELYRLQFDLAEALQRLGFTPEKRKFSPHITLARVREIDHNLSDMLQAQFKSLGIQKKMVDIEGLELLKSVKREGRPSVYETVKSYPFV